MSREIQKEFEKNKKTILIIVVTVLSVVVVFLVVNVFFGGKVSSKKEDKMINSNLNSIDKKLDDSDIKNSREQKRKVTINIFPKENTRAFIK